MAFTIVLTRGVSWPLPSFSSGAHPFRSKSAQRGGVWASYPTAPSRTACDPNGSIMSLGALRRYAPSSGLGQRC